MSPEAAAAAAPVMGVCEPHSGGWQCSAAAMAEQRRQVVAGPLVVCSGGGVGGIHPGNSPRDHAGMVGQSRSLQQRPAGIAARSPRFRH